MRDKLKVIAVDMDGTLCVGDAWTPEQALATEPRLDIIEKVNELAQSNFVVIFTARRDHMLPATLEWLRRNNVRFHAISNIKMPADVYVDDRAILPEDLLK
jgi:uncharacterized HAD superfamily protein